MDPEPHDELTTLYSANPALADRIDHWLDIIEANPADPRARRRLIIRPGRVWAISVPDPSDTSDWLILWDLDGETPVVRYLGPDILRPE